MTTRIYKKEQFIGRNGETAFQIYGELTAGNQTLPVDPWNPTPEELADFDEQFAAAQQATIADATSRLATITTKRDALQSQVDQHASVLAAKDEQVAALQAELDALKNPPVPDVATVTKQQAELALLEVGKLDFVEDLIAQAPREVQINYSRPT